MRYALNLAEDGRILSITYEKYASPKDVIVDELPEGNSYEYQYINGNYIYNPIPVETVEPVLSKTNAELTAENADLLNQVAALTEEVAFLEDCIAEMAEIVYA